MLRAFSLPDYRYVQNTFNDIAQEDTGMLVKRLQIVTWDQLLLFQVNLRYMYYVQCKKNNILKKISFITKGGSPKLPGSCQNVY